MDKGMCKPFQVSIVLLIGNFDACLLIEETIWARKTNMYLKSARRDLSNGAVYFLDLYCGVIPYFHAKMR